MNDYRFCYSYFLINKHSKQFNKNSRLKKVKHIHIHSLTAVRENPRNTQAQCATVQQLNVAENNDSIDFLI